MPITLDDDLLVGTWPPNPPPRPAPPRRSRRRKVLTATVSLLVAGMAGGGLWWHRAVTADPGLEFNAAAGNVFSAAGDKTGITEVANLVGEEASVAFVPDGRFSAWMSLYNGGPRDVTVEAFPAQGFYYWGVERVAVGTDGDRFPEGDGVPAPFRLEAGETRYLRVDFRMAGCDPTGLQDGFSAIGSLPVRYRTLGFPRTVEVPFDEAAIAVRTIGHCDRPILGPR